MGIVPREDPNSTSYLLKQILNELREMNGKAVTDDGVTHTVGTAVVEEPENQTAETGSGEATAGSQDPAGVTDPPKPGPVAVPAQGDASA